MTKREYNGWYNYETWNCALWIDNEEGSQGESHEIVEEGGREGVEDGSTAQALKDYVESNMVPDLGASFAADMLGAAMEEVNYQEIAENYASDIEWPEDEADEA